VLGLAFKPETDDLRESPAIRLIDLLLKEGARVLAYDPVAMPAARRTLTDREIRYCESLEETVKRAKAILLVTSWKEFERVPKLMTTLRRHPVLVDGRRQLDKQKVKNYLGVGL
jgi:UDPglucose 6-dehydrogenase